MFSPLENRKVQQLIRHEKHFFFIHTSDKSIGSAVLLLVLN